MKNVIKILVLVAIIASIVTIFLKMNPLVLFKNPVIGKEAPDFTLNDLNGKEVNFTDIRNGKKAIIFFWATWCPHCRTAIERLDKDREMYDSRGIRLILVDLGETAADVRAYFSNRSISFEVLLDDQGSVASLYSVIGVPSYFFINQSGKVIDIQHQMPEDYEAILNKP